MHSTRFLSFFLVAAASLGGCVSSHPSGAPEPEERCPDPSDPDVDYRSCVTTDAWTCPAGTAQFIDPSGCGCGCEPVACPDPTDPSVHYVAGSDADPSACLAILFTCREDQRPFSDECGCGCIDLPPRECPDPTDPRVHYILDSHEDPRVCLPILFGCEEDQRLFSDECGCGCIDLPPRECPDPTDPRVHYHGTSAEDPSLCARVDWGACAEGQTLFSDACGCGCIDDAPPGCPSPEAEGVTYHSCLTTDILDCPDGSVPFADPAGCGCGCVPSAPAVCPDPGRPGVYYHSCFTADAWTCPAGTVQFIDPSGCGCGCDPVACPDPADPSVHYVNDSYRDPGACTAILFRCETGQRLFSDECGCGCVDGE
ncbi:MAG: hypothetical protein KF729_39160 [Sandaracinaceae bacterium]|nr:hypothetical protein [Sandaracinaceae bacterium]